jgi:ribosomal protein L11 methyltransferase
MTSTLTPASVRATFSIGDEKTAKRTADLLAESFDNNEAAIAAFEASDKSWDITVHFADPPDQDAIRALVAMTAGDDAASRIAFETVEAKDWVKASLDGLAVVPAGRFIVHGQHHRDQIAPNSIGIEIEAALAFGTGHHGTTRGCLILLDDLLKRRTPRNVLDLGCGTGVLGIAAAKALRRHVLASDIDLKSTQVARENARLNGAGQLTEIVCAPGFSSPRFKSEAFDLVLANILANPLKRLAAPMARHLAPSAHVILSGQLPDQANAVIAAYRMAGLTLVRKIQIDGWASLLLRR